MAYLLGTDEAGYGPNLGPLVISATLWELPDALLRNDLFELLHSAVSREARALNGDRFAIADSKQLYKPGGGLGALERGVFATKPGESAASWRDVWPRFDQASADDFLSAPWYQDYDAALPCGVGHDEIANLREAFEAALRKCDIHLLAIESCVVRAATFNSLLSTHHNKAEVLTRSTLSLVAKLLANVERAPTLVYCDKHGGRSRYAPLLQQVFPEHLVEVHGEGRAESVYRWGPAAARVEVRFTAGGESALPTALASMASKYLRELAMQAFNDFWLREVPGIKPTAGYPVDAKRFHKQIAVRQAELGIDDAVLWRTR